MKRALIFAMILGGASCAFAQEGGNAVFFQSAGPVTTVGVGTMMKGPGAPVTGAPYSATMTNEFVQTLPDGTHITQSTAGNVARDSQGRTRQDASLPAIGNLSAADAPHLVFIQDPVSHTSYTLNLTDKIAQKMPATPMNVSTSGGAIDGPKIVMRVEGPAPAGAMPPPLPSPGIMIQKTFNGGEGNVSTEDLGTQTMQGIQVTGTRTTRTIPANEIGNDRAITIVTEVWTSPDLKTIVYSKRSDPRTGDQTFQLTNIDRSEPDASLFTVPSDFKIVEGPQDVIYRTNQ